MNAVATMASHRRSATGSPAFLIVSKTKSVAKKMNANDIEIE